MTLSVTSYFYHLIKRMGILLPNQYNYPTSLPIYVRLKFLLSHYLQWYVYSCLTEPYTPTFFLRLLDNQHNENPHIISSVLNTIMTKLPSQDDMVTLHTTRVLTSRSVRTLNETLFESGELK